MFPIQGLSVENSACRIATYGQSQEAYMGRFAPLDAFGRH